MSPNLSVLAPSPAPVHPRAARSRAGAMTGSLKPLLRPVLRPVPRPALKTALALCLALPLSLASLAANAGLYPPAAPPGSAYLRVFNATAQPKVAAQLGDKAIPETPSLDASSYVFVAPGQYALKIGGTEQGVKLDAARCYTTALGSDGIHVFDQDCFNSQLKAMLSVYNLIGGSTLSLKTADGSAQVIDGVAANAAAHREVNAVKVSLAVYDGATKLADAKPVTLERGKAFSLFVTGSREQPVLIWVVN